MELKLITAIITALIAGVLIVPFMELKQQSFTIALRPMLS